MFSISLVNSISLVKTASNWEAKVSNFSDLVNVVKLGIAPLFMADIFEKRLIPNEGVVNGLRSQSYFL